MVDFSMFSAKFWYLKAGSDLGDRYDDTIVNVDVSECGRTEMDQRISEIGCLATSFSPDPVHQNSPSRLASLLGFSHRYLVFICCSGYNMLKLLLMRSLDSHICPQYSGLRGSCLRLALLSV